MKLEVALRLVLDLAIQNIIYDAAADDDDDLQQEQDRQNEACLAVGKLIEIITNGKMASEVGEAIIVECKLKKKKNGRVDLTNGDKTPIGITRTIFEIFSNYRLAIVPQPVKEKKEKNEHDQNPSG